MCVLNGVLNVFFCIQGAKPGLLGDAPIGLAPAGYEGGPEPLFGFLGGPGENSKKRGKGDNDFPPRKKSRSGLPGAVPSGFDILDDGYVHSTKGRYVP